MTESVKKTRQPSSWEKVAQAYSFTCCRDASVPLGERAESAETRKYSHE